MKKALYAAPILGRRMGGYMAPASAVTISTTTIWGLDWTGSQYWQFLWSAAYGSSVQRFVHVDLNTASQSVALR